MPLVDLLVATGVATSRGDARRSIEGGGVYVNNHRVSEPAASVTTDDMLAGEFVVMRKGKKSYHLVRLI